MKRAGRIVYRLLSGLSLLLLLATVVVWVRSYWVSDWLFWSDPPTDQHFFYEKSIWSSRGGVQFTSGRNFSTQAPMRYSHVRERATKYPIFGDYWAADPDPKPRPYVGLGFEWVPQTKTRWAQTPDHESIQSLTLPLYFPCLIFALLPAHSFLRLRRRRRIARRIAQGCCIGCGYDLRVSSGRCPECGLPVSGV